MKTSIKSGLLGLPRVYLVVLLFLVLCGAAGAQSGENWFRLESLEDLVGTWEGVQNIAIPRNDEAGLPQSSIGLTIILRYKAKATNLTMEMIIDLNRLLNDFISIPGFAETGMTKADLWNFFVEMMSGIMGDLKYDNKKYTMTFSQTDSAELSEDDSVEINQNKKKIRLSFPEPVSFGLGDEGINEIILDKTSK